MSEESGTSDKPRRSRLTILLLLGLPLLLITILCGSTLGLNWPRADWMGIGVEVIETADYSPWERTRFAPVQPRLGTAIAAERTDRPAYVALGVTETPTPIATTAAPSATVPPATATATPTPPPPPAATTEPGPVTIPTTVIVDLPTIAPSATATATATDTVPPPPTLTPPPTATPLPAPDTATPVPVVLAPTASPPVASFQVNPVSGSAPHTITIVNQSVGQITSYTWNFGDGTGFSTNPAPGNYTYTAPGTYFLSLLVTGPGGSTTASTIITVAQPPTSVPPPTATPTSTETLTPTPTLTETPRPTPTETPTPTDEPPVPNCPNAGEPNIGPANGIYCHVNGFYVVDLGANPVINGPGYDLVYYERLAPSDPSLVYMDTVRVDVATSLTAPVTWHTVFEWGDGDPDLNTNLGQSTYAESGESDDQPIPVGVPHFYGSAPHIAGVTIDLNDPMLPGGPYRYVRISGDHAFDAVEVLNVAPPPQADLRLTVSIPVSTAQVDDTIIETITIYNDGPVDATNVQVSESYLAGYTGPLTTVWTIPLLPAGQMSQITIGRQIPESEAGTTTTRWRTVVYSDQTDPDSTYGNYNPAEDDYSSYTLTVESADLELTFFMSATEASVGDFLTAIISVTNNGPFPATGIVVSDSRGSGALGPVQSVTLSHGDSSGDTWTIDSLNVGETASMTIVVQVEGEASGTTVSRWREILDVDQFDPDSQKNNGVATEDDYDGYTVTVWVSNNVTLTGTGTATASPDDQFTTTFTITQNQRTFAQTGVEVYYPVPAGAQYESFVADQGSYNPGSGMWIVGNIPPSPDVGPLDTVSITITWKVTSGIGSAITHTATITDSSPTDLITTDNTFTLTTDVVNP